MLLPSSLLYTLLTLLELPSPSRASPLDAALPTTNASLLWGPYRPNLYLGIRPRVPESLFMGLMWGNFEEGHKTLRHTCEQNEGMAGYGWTAYDTRRGGTQTIPDVGNKINITTEFVKISEGSSRGNWGLRVRGTPREGANGLKTVVVFYVAMEAMEKCQGCGLMAEEGKISPRDNRAERKVVFWSKSPDLGGVNELHLVMPKHEMAAVKSVNMTEDVLWKSKSIFVDLLKDEAQSKQGNLVIANEPGVGNAHFAQMVFKDQFEFDVLFNAAEATLDMSSLDITTELETTLESFTTTYTQVFSPTWPFNSEPYVVFGQALLSNLLGGLGYFYGDTKVDESHAPEYEEKEPNFWEKVAEARKRIEPATKGPSELFTHVPSRANFPRGFLWDEGFHLLPVLDWDADLALEVLQSWLELMDEDGWIAREQVMGPEARSKVPPDFVTQSPHIANPPTLFIVISHFVDMLAGRKKYLGQGSKYLADPEMGRSLLSQIYPKLKRHYEWFRRTQFGDVEAHSLPRASLSEGYRWRGRTPGYNLGSGLDDYPRAEPPDITELHVDALSWVGLMAQVLTQTAEHIHQEEDLSTYHAHTKAITQNLEEIHWSDNAAAYCDTRVYDDGHHFTCPKGYVSLSPFYTGLLGPEHPRLNATLDLLRDPQLLWTPYGVRSLSPESTQYGKGDNYWRSPIWININYLLLTQLLSLATTPGPLKARCRELYRDLRLNVVQNVYHQWSTTGFAWEQYNPDTGAGQRTQHFTGWTALVVRLMALPGLEGEEKEGYRVMVGHVGKVVKEHAGSGRGMGAGAVVVGLGLVVFFWMSRRKVARLRRGLGRRLL